jgi:hypothetical protein
MNSQPPVYVDYEAPTIEHINWRCRKESVLYTMSV